MPLPSDATLEPKRIKRWLACRLLDWFARWQRDLPWRKDRDAYRIWVSEVMLQQTQVATVIPYFERFLAAFPTLAGLAAATEQQVLRLWEGLGYYRRARDLHRAAKVIVATHGATFPREPESLRGVPGMGRYTANAVLSQAFEKRLPILEANSVRVLCRLFGKADDPTRNPLRNWLWQAAEEILPHKHVGHFNQAMMELGALVCTPAAPACGKCPLRGKCVARARGLQATIPLRAAPAKATEVRESAVVVRRGGRLLLVQRPTTGRWASMWEFPHDELTDGETHTQAALRLLRERTSLSVTLGPEIETIRHGVTRFRITMVCFVAVFRQGKFRSEFYADSRWVLPAELASYPVSAPQRILARTLASNDE
jgi:A/G-specific adenine glycosylase